MTIFIPKCGKFHTFYLSFLKASLLRHSLKTKAPHREILADFLGGRGVRDDCLLSKYQHWAEDT